MSDPLSHVDEQGRARMVDVGEKPVTARRAVASGRLRLSPQTLERALSGDTPKGPVLETARLAGIAAAKRTFELIPLCHVLALDVADVQIEPDPDEPALVLRAEVAATARTGVEMEALTAVAVAGLTLVDMLKAVQKDLVLDAVRLESKTGGRSGPWRRP